MTFRVQYIYADSGQKCDCVSANDLANDAMLQLCTMLAAYLDGCRHMDRMPEGIEYQYITTLTNALATCSGFTSFQTPLARHVWLM